MNLIVLIEIIWEDNRQVIEVVKYLLHGSLLLRALGAIMAAPRKSL